MNNFVNKLIGPIMIFGAGGFVGKNLSLTILKSRSDVISVTSDQCNLLNQNEIEKIIKKYKPQTIFNLAAYGGNSKQEDIDKIYLTNFNSTINLIEILKKYGFRAYIQAGSQSEYGINSCAPSETDELIPNSHYSVSKIADYYLLKYFGKFEKLPVVHLRLYSVYGTFEQPNRLMPTLIKYVKNKSLPKFVNANISHDFIYVDDVIEALITVAIKLKKSHYGEAFNIATGVKTTMKELAYLSKRLFNIKVKPSFGSMKNRQWDLSNWYGNPGKMKKVFAWKSRISLREGLLKIYNLKID